MIGHGAANVTLGIPRLREIVMTASQKPKTPSMTVKVRSGVALDTINLFCKRATRVTLAQVVDHVVVQELLWREGLVRKTRLTVDINFYPKEEYLEEYDLVPSDILFVFGHQFPITLKKEMMAELRKLDSDMRTQMAKIGQGKKISNEGEAEGDEEGEERPTKSKGEDDDESADEGDADAEKRLKQNHQQGMYESDDEEEDGGHDDAAIEAQNADANNDSVEEATTAKKPKKSIIEANILDNFQRHLHQCISFSFKEDKCTFTLEVNNFFDHWSRSH